MKVILLQELKGKGGEGDVVDVAPGFANNYLLPQKVAILATKGNLKQLEQRKHNIAKREENRLADAGKIKETLDGALVKVEAKVGEEGQLFGSVTAQMIADAINAEADGRYEYVYDRTQVRQKRGAQELGISSVRGGGIVGEHDVLFCGPDEVVTLSHSAGSRGVFADGAVQAALYIAALAPGYYTMTDLLRGKLICE